MEVAQAVDNSGSAKRRKVGSGELRLTSSKPVRITSEKKEFIGGSYADEMSSCSGDIPASYCSCNGSVTEILKCGVEKKELIGAPYVEEMSFCSGDTPASCCSSDGSIVLKPKCSDLEEGDEIETTVRGNLDRRESLTLQIKPHILSPNFMAEKQPVKVESRRTIPPEKTPPAAELEEFFAAAEKDLHNRFKNKYNYDIVNDVPLKGRFEWVELKR